ncbi:eukaryotic peptide chain release factor GTP-binding subunit ERF3A [Tanacetum coccineum]
MGDLDVYLGLEPSIPLALVAFVRCPCPYAFMSLCFYAYARVPLVSIALYLFFIPCSLAAYALICLCPFFSPSSFDENRKPTGQVFIADLHIHKQLNVTIVTAGFTAVLHIDSEYDEFEILELIQKINPKTKEPIKDKRLFVSKGDRVICRIQMFNMTSIEKSYEFQQFKRFTVHIPEGEASAAIVKVIELA